MACSSYMEELLQFYDFMMLILVFIMSMVVWNLFSAVSTGFTCTTLQEIPELETVWTVVPAVILVAIAVPSLELLYTMEEGASAALVLKVSGNQWYWSYETPESEVSAYVKVSAKETGLMRLLETSATPWLPTNVMVRAMISSSDVLHSWTVPSLGVKADACPGRMNMVEFKANKSGLFFGQCSEICGAYHSFMPIALYFTSF